MTAHYTVNVLVKNEKTCISLLATYAAFNILLKITIQKSFNFAISEYEF